MTSRYCRRNSVKTLLLGSTVLVCAVASLPAYAQDAETMETVTVTGYRASLTDSTNAKRASVSFSDAIFAEDIGKFPDSNVAEAVNRIPGVTIQREIDGTGMRIAIRGMDTNYTKILLNNTAVATPTAGPITGGGSNREVDLNMFPTELFTQLTVSKSQTSDMLEGGAAGVVNMRTMRPFDNPGTHLTYIAQASTYAKSWALGPRGALVGSYTDGPFGILVGLTGQMNHIFNTGYETVGFTNLNMNASQFYTPAQITGGATCAATTIPNASNTNSCNPTGGDNSWVLPATVPSNAKIPGVAPGTVIDQALLAKLNPGVSMTQLSNGLLPRLGRPMLEKGTRDRYNGVIALEYRPTEALHFYLDAIGARVFNDFDRSDINLIGRNSNLIPADMVVDGDNVITSATFYNAQFFLEARPYKEKADYLSFNPGFDWQASDMLHVDGQVNWSESHFFRDNPTILPTTPQNAGFSVKYSAAPGAVPTFDTGSFDLNDPANYGWYPGSRVNLSQEQRYLYTKGFHFNASYGGEEMMVKGGIAYDESFRHIAAYVNDDAWQAAVCGGNPSFFLPGPNTRPNCDGINATNPSAYSAPGFGTGYSAGQSVTWLGSLIPNSAFPNYLTPGPTGFVLTNYGKFLADSHYNAFAHSAPLGVPAVDGHAPIGTTSVTGAGTGDVMEATTGYYAELTGTLHHGDQKIKYNIGTRWVRTHQIVTGVMSVTDPRNVETVTCPNSRAPASCTSGTAVVQTLDGARYPNTISYPTGSRTYNALLPAASMVWEVSDDFVVRGALSRTMTRPMPSSLIPNMNFSDVSAQTATLGNINLKPYFSNNIDIGAELYTGGEGYFGVALFRKMITGFSVNQQTPEPFSYLSAWGITYNTLAPDAQRNLGSIGRAGTPGGCNSDATCANTTIYVNQQVNNHDVQTINGMEFTWVQPLDFWLKGTAFEGFGWTANATFIRVKAPASNPNVVLGVPKFTYNATGYYENYGLSVHMSYTWNDGSAAQRSPQNNLDLVQYGAPTGVADLSASYKLAEIFGDLPTSPEVTFNIQNMFKAKQRGYMGGQAGTYSLYAPGSVVIFGVRGSL